MPAEPDISVVATLIGEPARAAMLMALMDGEARSAGELARCARVSPQTASSHLAKLVEGQLLTVTSSGRHRYYTLSSLGVAQALEALSAIAPRNRARTLRDGKKAEALCNARTCYDHLAGALGVALACSLVERGFLVLEPECSGMTDAGLRWLDTWGIDSATLHKTRRIFVRPCLDWSERRFHIGGAVGAVITRELFERNWISRIPQSRGVVLTEFGKAAFEHEFGIRTV